MKSFRSFSSCFMFILTFILLSSQWQVTAAREQADIPHRDLSSLRFTNLSTKDGLSQTMVSTIYQDRFGFMWFGTEHGLNRYDGYEFTTYRNDPTNLNTLPGNSIRFITEDSTGLLWIITQSITGLANYDIRTNTFTRYVADNADSGLPAGEFVNGIYEDAARTLWVATDRGLAYFDRANNHFVPYLPGKNAVDSVLRSTVRDFIQDADKTIWVMTNAGIAYWDVQEHQFIEFPFDLKQVNIKNYVDTQMLVSKAGIVWIVDGKSLHALNPVSGEVQSYPYSDVIYSQVEFVERRYNMFEDSSGNIWFANAQYVYKFDTSQKRFRDYIFPEITLETIQCIFEDSSGTLWLCGGNQSGLWYYDNALDQFIRVGADSTNPLDVNIKTAISIYQDRSGILWIGSHETGVYKLDQRAIQFDLYRHNPNDPNSLSTNYIYSIYKDREGILWVGGDDGILNRIDQGNNTFRHYLPDAQNPTALNESASVSAILEDREGGLWAGTFGGGLHLLDRSTDTFTRFTVQDGVGLQSNIILSLLETADHTLWVGQAYPSALQRYDPETNGFIDYDLPPEHPIFAGEGIRVMYEDRQGNLWVGSWDSGLFRINRTTGQVDAYQHNDNDPTTLSNNSVYAIREDQAGKIWVGTSSGLNQYDPTQNNFIVYGETDGLPNNTIYAVMPDHVNQIWLTSNRGITRFNPTTGQIDNYTIINGIQDYEFNQSAYYQSDDGEIFLGGVNGLNFFRPERVVQNPFVPPIIITGFQIFNQDVPYTANGPLKQSAMTTHEITLPYTDSVFSFEFTALSFSNPELNRYRYRLEDFEENWNEVNSDRRFATYTSIPGGNYRFQVQGSNEDGVWNENGATIQITIIPPFWETGWFRVLAVGVLAVSGVGFFQVRTATIRRRARTLALLVDERTRNLKVMAEVSYQVSNELNNEKLLTQLVELTAKSFNFAQVNIYLYAEMDETLRLVASSAKQETPLLKIGKSFNLNTTSGIVMDAARGRKAIIIDNIQNIGINRNNPNEVSEIVVPIIFRGDLIGVLELKSQKSDRFAQEDVELFTSFANQIATAIRNARLFEELIYARERAEQADRAKSSFLASMSHELRTPLNAVINFSKAMRKGIPGPVNTKQEQLLDGIADSGQHLLNLINDVLDIYKIEADSFKLFIEPNLDIRAVIQFAVNMSKPLLGDKPVEIQQDIADTLPLISADRKRLLQIMLNLLSNACKFTEKGYVKVTAKADDDHILITVQDTGYGIDAADAKSVFEAFKQTESGLRQGGGTGLGMPLSKKLVEAHRGRLWFESEIGKGTTFFVELPVNRVPTATR